MKRHKVPVFCLLSLLFVVPHASAHYLWVAVDGGDEGAQANIYFEEGPAARDGQYLDPILATNKTWWRTVENIEPQLVEVADIREDEKRWLQATLPAASPRSVDAYGKYGVYFYGDTPVLLHYYARYLDVSAHEDLHELGRAEHMDLDIVPHDHGADVELTVIWNGEPAAGRTIHIRGPERFGVNITTDEHGRAEFTPEAAGRYLFRTNVELATPGQDGDDDYDLIRHHATLIMTLPLEE